VAVIELDLYAPAEPEPRRPSPRPVRYRIAALGVAVLLALALGGAARPESRLLQAGGSAPMTATGSFLLVGGRLYTFDLRGATLTTTAWSPAPTRRLWSRNDRVLAANGESGGIGWYATPTADDGVLLQTDLNATVLDARTGAVRWHRTALISVLRGRYGLLYDEKYRPDTDYDDGEGTDGPVFYGSDGTLHVQPPFHTDLRVLDMVTGEQKWTAAYSGKVIATVAPAGPGELLVYADDKLSLRSAETGAVRLVRTLHALPPSDLMYGSPVVGDVVLAAGPGEVTAYSARTLEPLWRRPRAADAGADPYACVDLLCEYHDADTTVLDPATGKPLWTLDGLSGLRAAGADVYVMGDGQQRVLEVRDAATGALRADLRRWDLTVIPQDGAPLVISRPDRGGVAFTMVRPGGVRQPLGISNSPVTECQNDPRHLVCRTVSGVQVWTYAS
jgi:outer membrane protein assembly factor BamB